MKVMSVTQLRKNLAAALDQLTDDCEPVLITRGHGKPNAVLMSLDDFAGYEETRYLLASPANAERLRASIKEAEEGKLVPFELPD